jgi:hypothetical protein
MEHKIERLHDKLLIRLGAIVVISLALFKALDGFIG